MSPFSLFIAKVYAAGDASGVIGTVPNPLQGYGNFNDSGSGVVVFFTNILRLVFVAAGVMAFINLIVAGFQYMTAAGDSKAVAAAWNRIQYSLIGLVILVASFAIAAVLGAVLFGDAMFILKPKIYGPGN
jgi:hypothetical protein